MGTANVHTLAGTHGRAETSNMPRTVRGRGARRSASTWAQDSADLSIEENEDSVILTWEPYPETALYEIHGAGNNPYFFIAPQPGTDYLITTVPSSQNSWETTYGIGDPDENWAFLIIAKDETDTELARSNRVGEHDFLLDYPE